MEALVLQLESGEKLRMNRERMEEGEGKLHLIGSRKFGVESKSGRRKQTWKLMAERVRCDAMGNREPLRILEQGNGLVR